jgi:hypothetical protein
MNELVKVRFKINSVSLDPDEIVGMLTQNAAEAFRSKIGPHIVDVAQARAPVSKERRFKPRPSSFENLDLMPLDQYEGPNKSMLVELRGMEGPDRARAFKQAFATGRTRKGAFTSLFQGRGPKAGTSPDELRLRRGTIQGAFRHKPGTLKRSIKLDSVEIKGNRVVATVRAHAPYARYVHEGKPRGRQPNPFLRSALANVFDELTDGSTYIKG